MLGSASLREAYGALRQLGGVFVKSARDAPLSEILPFVEAKLSERLATVRDAEQRPNATTTSVIQALMDEDTALRAISGASSSTSAAAAPAFEGEGAVATEVRGDSVEAAILTPVFKDIGRKLERADLRSEAGRLEAIAIAFNVESPLAMRALCKPLKASAIVARVPTLAVLSDLHRSVPSYLSWLLAADPLTKVVPGHMKKYDIRGLQGVDGSFSTAGLTFLRQLLEFDWARADWVYSPGGLLVWRAIKNGGGRALEDRSAAQRLAAHVEECHPYDIFTKPEVVRDLGGFIGQILLAMGFAAEVQDEARDGVPFPSFLKFYLAHLDKVSSYVTLDERYRFLDHCHLMFALALRKISDYLQGAVYGAVYRGKDLTGGVLQHSEDPILAMEKAEATRLSVLAMREEYDLFMRAQGSAVAPISSYFGILRSTNPAHKQGAAAAKAQRLNAVKEPGSSSGHQQEKKTPAADKSVLEAKQESSPSGAAGTPSAVAEPGTLTASWAWLNKDELYVSGLVWNIDRLAKALRTTRDAKCWPWLLTLRSEANKPGVCDKWGQSGHKTASDAAHKDVPSFDRVKMSGDPKMCRTPSAEERQAHSERMSASGIARPPARAAGRGRGRGRGVRGGSQLPA